MSLHNYIVVTDISHIHLKQFQLEVLQPYIDEANAMYEDLSAFHVPCPL